MKLVFLLPKLLAALIGTETDTEPEDLTLLSSNTVNEISLIFI